MTATRTLFVPAMLIALAATGAPANAGTPEAVTAPTTAPFHLDVEVDPTAYVLSGYSLHVGLGWRRVRLDLGAYALALPSVVQRNDAFDVSFHGFGAKLQYFMFHDDVGAFVGVDGGVAWQLAERTSTNVVGRDRQVSLGINAGYRIALGHQLYVTPWIGVSRAFGVDATMLNGATFEPQRVVVFPAIHLGYRIP